jgi:hypothetical protein
LTSQLAFAAEDCATAYADPRYEGSRPPLSRVSIASDSVFRNNTPEQIAQATAALTGNTDGFTAAVTVPVLRA